MRYKVIQEFPGLRIGDVLTKEEGTNFYVLRKENSDISDSKEIVEISTVYIDENTVTSESDYFELEESKPKQDLDNIIDDMLQVASLFEADKVTAMNPYHGNLLEEVIKGIYSDVNILKGFRK